MHLENASWIEAAVASIAQWEPGFPRQVFPATAHEVEELERLRAAGAPMPAVYRDFLSRMGHGLAMPALPAARYDIGDIVARYRHGYLPPPGFWMLGRAHSDPYFDVYLFSPTGAESRVVSMPPPPPQGGPEFAAFARRTMLMLAGNLPQWLCAAALRQYRFPQFPAQWVGSSAQPGARKLAACDSMLVQAGFSPYWFSDDWQRIYEAPGRRGLVFVTEFPGMHTAALLRMVNDDALQSLRPAVELALR